MQPSDNKSLGTETMNMWQQVNTKAGRSVFLLVGILSAVIAFSPPALASSKEVAQSDHRILLPIPFQDRDHLLHVMRNNLANLGRMIDAMSEDDFEAARAIADKMSFNKKKGKGLAQRGNPEFTAMGVHFHALDTLAIKNAAEQKDRKGTLRAMSKMASSCVACHETFRVTEWPDNKVYT